jgi:hypothetical protein
MATQIVINIDGAQVLHLCTASHSTPANERKFAAILMATLDAAAVALSKNSGECVEYENLNKLIQPEYLPRRMAEMLGPMN